MFIVDFLFFFAGLKSLILILFKPLLLLTITAGVASLIKQETQSTGRYFHPQRPQLLVAIEQEIATRLQETLHNWVLKNLWQEEVPKPIFRPDIDVKIAKQAKYQLAPETPIINVFDEAEGRMLILGGCGSGKTSLLLELGSQLCQRAWQNESLGLPVLLDLIGWHSQQDFFSWLVTELSSKYSLEPSHAYQGLENGEFILLLDGLDELKDEQENCILAINHFIESCPQYIQIVVSTRFNDYKKCQARLRLKAAILLRPLREETVKEYLFSCRSRELWYQIETEAHLLELAKNPLCLNMMALADEEILIHSWKRLSDTEALRQYLVSAYIRRQLGRVINSDKKITAEKAKRWLTWLAKQMQQNDQVEFNAQQLPVQWLKTTVIKKMSFLAKIVGRVSRGNTPFPKQLVLRFIFWQNGYTPWNYGKFLTLMSEYSLLQQSGMRYRFNHQLLQEHLATWVSGNESNSYFG